jgi:radical SAM superfamily enzyme YgiQ (UPF0313 family)
MKVLLILPPFLLNEIYGGLSRSAPILPPLELAYIASYLASYGHKVSLIDAHALGLNFNDLKAIIEREDPDMVGMTTDSPIFSFIYSLYSRVLEAIRLVKSIRPAIKTCLIGYHPTILPQEVLAEDSVDYAIIGEPEITIKELCDCLEFGKNLKDICGLGFKVGQEQIINKPREMIANLDILPMPSYNLLPMDKYRFASDTPVPVKGVAIRASRGCAYNCYFCSAVGFWKNQVGTHSPEYVISMMNYLYEHYQFRRFQFHDDNFGINWEWIMRFCRRLLENRYKYEWECYSRFDLLDEQALMMMKKAGCRMISLGVEFGSDEILRKVKGLTKQKIEAGIALLRKTKLKSRLFFMIGPPAKTKEDIKDTVRYALRLDPDAFVATISIPFPGSRFYAEMKKIGSVPNFRDRLIPIYEAPFDILGFKKEYLDQMIRYAYRSFYLRPAYIIKHFSNICKIKNISYYLKGLYYVFKA